MKKILLIGLVVLMAVIMSGCASYNTIGAVPMLDRIEKEKLIKVEKEGVIITAFPITNKSDSKKYFDEDIFDENIINRRVLAVYIHVSNGTANNVKVVSLSMNQKEKVVMPMAAEEMYKVLRREYFIKAFLWMFPTYFIGAPVSVVHTAFVNNGIEEDIKEKQIQLGKEIKPGQALQGFVWFRINDFSERIVLKLILEQDKNMIIEHNLSLSIIM